MKVCVVGLGNIGLQLLLDLHNKEINAVGVDIKPEVVDTLRKRGYQATCDLNEFHDIDIWLVAISTGLHMENLLDFARKIRPKPGALISIESTLIPGTMVQLARIFEEERGYEVGHNLFFIHVPHRVNFGIDRDVFEQPRVIGGITKACLRKGLDFYQPLIRKMIPVNDVRIAELAKIIENSSRHLNIAFAETVYQYCLDENLNFNELREAVNSKNNVNLLDIDYGIGGECLSKDMQFLYETIHAPLMGASLQSDQDYRNYLFELLKYEKGVLISGITYKPELKNIYFSRAVELYQRLVDFGTAVYVEDALLTAIELREFGLKLWNGEPITVIINRGKIYHTINEVFQ